MRLLIKHILLIRLEFLDRLRKLYRETRLYSKEGGIRTLGISLYYI